MISQLDVTTTNYKKNIYSNEELPWLAIPLNDTSIVNCLTKNLGQQRNEIKTFNFDKTLATFNADYYSQTEEDVVLILDNNQKAIFPKNRLEIANDINVGNRVSLTIIKPLNGILVYKLTRVPFVENDEINKLKAEYKKIRDKLQIL